MSRRKKNATNASDDTFGEWNEEERNRLTDALKRDSGENNWRWIARQVKTKTVAQVKEFASKLNTDKQPVYSRATALEQQSKSGKRPIAPKDDGPLEGWINATKRMRDENDVDGTCIPQALMKGKDNVELGVASCPSKQNERSRSQEHTGTSDNNSNGTNECENIIEDNPEDSIPFSEDVDQQESILPPAPVVVDPKLESAMKELLENQKQMIEEISVLRSRLDENLQSINGLSQTSVMDLLNKMNSRIDELYKIAPHGLCNGTVIIQTPSHANVIHKPILDSCSSCRVDKEGERCSGSENVDNSKTCESEVRRSPVLSNTLGRASAETVHGLQEVSPRLQAMDLTTSSSCIPSHSSNVLQSTGTANQVNCNAGGSLEQTESSVPSTTPSVNRSLVAVLSQSPMALSVVNTKSTPNEGLIASRQQNEFVSEHDKSSGPLHDKVTIPYNKTGINSAMDKTSPQKTLLPSSFIDLHSTLTLNPPSTVTSTAAVKSTVAPTKSIPVVNLSETSYSPQNTPIVANITTGASTSLQKMPHEQSSRSVLHNATTPVSAQSTIPAGFINLSYPNMALTPKVVHVTSPLHPQPVRVMSLNSNQQGKSLSPAAVGSVIRNSVNEANAKQTGASAKEIMNAAMLISGYVTEHPNKEQEAQWQSCLSAIITDCHKNQTTSSDDMQQLVSVGCNPYVALSLFELEDMLDKAKGRPKFFALRLAERLFGLDILIKSTPYGIGNKDALHPAILDAIKVEVLKRFGANMSTEEQTLLWKGCVTSIAQRCKRARNPRRNRTSKGGLSIDDDLGPPSMAVERGMLREEHEDSQSDSEGEDEDYNLGKMMVTEKNTPPHVQIPSDDNDNRKEKMQNGDQDDVFCTGEGQGQRLVRQEKNISGHLEAPGKSSVKGSESNGSKRDIPPGIDPDITVVHIPSSLQIPVGGQMKQTEKVPPPIRQSSAVSSDSDRSSANGKAEDKIVTVKAAETVHRSVAHERQNCCDSHEKVTSVTDLLRGDIMQMAQSHRLGVSPGSISVSGIKMSPDYTHVLVGGNPNVALPRQKYLDALTRSSQPTHFAVRLAELAFGDDILVASTVTGGKRGTMQLDPNVISAIQDEVAGRFLNDLSPEQQNVVWRKCVTSIATRCKTLRYNRARAGETRDWTFHSSQDGPRFQGSFTPEKN
ncbi:uncharacterized protein LOC114953866 isoform X1 [Acropora millepora]|uniref:uncharacterized protein LOC114953866 isoform X1 n=1 Tax=Acropora millepora TaxID=45264 RepID=UPI001CF17A46|nr:uncharacterized protein LOC114953866 isoform X1 [Acropora millepora]